MFPFCLVVFYKHLDVGWEFLKRNLLENVLLQLFVWALIHSSRVDPLLILFLYSTPSIKCSFLCVLRSLRYNHIFGGDLCKFYIGMLKTSFILFNQQKNYKINPPNNIKYLIIIQKIEKSHAHPPTLCNCPSIITCKIALPLTWSFQKTYLHVFVYLRRPIFLILFQKQRSTSQRNAQHQPNPTTLPYSSPSLFTL